MKHESNYSIQMKIGIVFLCVAVIVGLVNECQAQDMILSESGLVTYELVISSEGVSADKLFDKSKIWVMEHFKSKQMQDSKPLLITTVFNYNVNIGLGVTNPFYHDLKIKVKDGAVKLIIDNIYNDVGHDPAERLFVKDGVITGKSAKKWLKQINDNCVNIGKSLQTAIVKTDDF